jgi:GTP-binding protein
LPPPDRPEYAFIGRSNVGKSSLLNMLVSSKGLAKTSGSPGKTQTINHFLINESWYLADLPGYGYARVSQKMRDQWDRLFSAYVTHRENLISLFVAD